MKNDSLSVKLRSTQTMVETLGKVFNVSATIFLVGEDGTVATPTLFFDVITVPCDIHSSLYVKKKSTGIMFSYNVVL